MFCEVDHYEPGTIEPGAPRPSREIETQRVNDLLTKYPALVENHKDSAGNVPRRTWFFPPHYHRNNSLRKLVELCAKGYGEIELHLHHGTNKPDTPENLENTILKTVEEYSEFGIFGTHGGQKKYGFIHGNWALGNSFHNKYCGVNNEIEILKRTGCYADFTFPGGLESNPFQINSLFYARENPLKPKSHRYGTSVKTSRKAHGDLMIIQGPLYPHKIGTGSFLTSIEANAAAIGSKFSFTNRRVDILVKAGIHVKGKNNWIVIKTHTHGAVNDKIVLGDDMDKVYSYLETKYNDGSNYILHYVTARELYNIIKALEDGKTEDNPELYRDYEIAPPRYNTSTTISEMSDELNDLIYL